MLSLLSNPTFPVAQDGRLGLILTPLISSSGNPIGSSFKMIPESNHFSLCLLPSPWCSHHPLLPGRCRNLLAGIPGPYCLFCTHSQRDAGNVNQILFFAQYSPWLRELAQALWGHTWPGCHLSHFLAPLPALFVCSSLAPPVPPTPKPGLDFLLSLQESSSGYPHGSTLPSSSSLLQYHLPRKGFHDPLDLKSTLPLSSTLILLFLAYLFRGLIIS